MKIIKTQVQAKLKGVISRNGGILKRFYTGVLGITFSP